MKVHRLLSLFAVLLLVVAAFLPWILVNKNVLTGMDTAGTRFGKPAVLHFILGGLYLLSVAIKKVWSQYTAVVISAFNIAWTVRNFLLTHLLAPACIGDECPTRGFGLYLLILAAAGMFTAPLLQPASSVKGL